MSDSVRDEIVKFLIEDNNVTFTLDILEHMDSIKREINNRFWHELAIISKERLVKESPGWEVDDTEGTYNSTYPIIKYIYKEKPHPFCFGIEKEGSGGICHGIPSFCELKNFGENVLNKPQVEKLVNILKNSGCKISCSDTWLRYGFLKDSQSAGNQYFREVMERQLAERVIDECWILFDSIKSNIETVNEIIDFSR